MYQPVVTGECIQVDERPGSFVAKDTGKAVKYWMRSIVMMVKGGIVSIRLYESRDKETDAPCLEKTGIKTGCQLELPLTGYARGKTPIPEGTADLSAVVVLKGK